MKFAVDDRIKHRVVGLAVILSVVAIFLPAILKRTNQPFDALSRVSVRIPSKPAMPEVKMVEQAKLFKSVKTAKVEVRALPVVVETTTPKPVSLVHAPKPQVHVEVAQLNPRKHPRMDTLPHASVVPPAPKIEMRNASNGKMTEPRALISGKTSRSHSRASVTVLDKPRDVVKIQAPSQLQNKNAYAVQVAYFSSLENVNGLIQKLKSKGFDAHYTSVKRAAGETRYKVLVGRSHKKDEVVRVQRELSTQMQIQGFVVPAEIG
jgi:DedD protein